MRPPLTLTRPPPLRLRRLFDSLLHEYHSLGGDPFAGESPPKTALVSIGLVKRVKRSQQRAPVYIVPPQEYDRLETFHVAAGFGRLMLPDDPDDTFSVTGFPIGEFVYEADGERPPKPWDVAYINYNGDAVWLANSSLERWLRRQIQKLRALSVLREARAIQGTTPRPERI